MKRPTMEIDQGRFDPLARFVVWTVLLAAGLGVLGDVARFYGSSFRFACGQVFWVLGFLRWLVVLRRLISMRSAAQSAGWQRTIRWLLWGSVLVGPAVTGVFIIWMKLDQSGDGWAAFGRGIRMIAAASISTWAGLAAGGFAFFAQLWRDHWEPTLTKVSIGYHSLIFLILAGMTVSWQW